MSVDINRAIGTLQSISAQSQKFATDMTTAMNTIALTRAMQEGYRMACRDNGLPVPDMADPEEEYFGVRS